MLTFFLAKCQRPQRVFVFTGDMGVKEDEEMGQKCVERERV